jgi:hypothetical protein
MSNIALTENQIQQFDTLNSFFEENRVAFSKILTFDSLVNEAHVLNTLESSIPENLRFDLHLDLVLKNGVTSYYKSMSSGTNYILEAARKIFPDSEYITESIESFKEYLILLLNEDSLSMGLPMGAAVPAAPMVPRTSGGFWKTLKDLWYAVSEGGSAWGIFHFIIDIIGLVGDFIFPGVGVVADLINAIAYYCRGEMMLCAISLIAAFVIGFGDALKLVKFAAKPAEKVMVTLAKEGGAEAGAKMLSKMPAKEQGAVLKILSSVAGNIGGVLGKATSLLGKFFEGFGKVTKWIPGLGGMLNRVFKALGSTLSEVGGKMTLFGANLKLATASAKKAAALTIDTAVKGGGDFIIDGPWIKVLSKEGKQIGKYPAKQIEKLTGEQLAELTAKKAGSKDAAKILYKNGDDIIKTNKVLTDPKIQDSLRRRLFTFFETTPLRKMSSRVKKDLIFFIGKQIYKIIFKSDWVEGHSNWTKDEVLGHGNGSLNSWIDDKISKERKKSGAVYMPYVELDSSDKETLDKITDYQNHFAKLHGQPGIMNVVYDKYGNEKTSDEFDEFFEEIGKGNVEYGKEGDLSDHTISNNLNKELNNLEKSSDIDISSSKTRFESRTVFSFSDFKK